VTTTTNDHLPPLTPPSPFSALQIGLSWYARPFYMYLLFLFINVCKLSVFRVSLPNDFLTTTHTDPVVNVFCVYCPSDSPRGTPTDSFIYVLALNESTGKIEYKVGSTGRTPEIRLREWIRGHPSKGFNLVYAMKVQGRETAFAIGELCNFLDDKELTITRE
jgi:hypothetical protein